MLLSLAMVDPLLSPAHVITKYPVPCSNSPSTDGTNTSSAPNTATLLHGSIFDTHRFNPENSTEFTNLYQTEYRYPKDPFDPRTLTINENLLNSLLSNITISTLSLGVEYAMVPVTITNFRNTYVFSNLLNFFLPYALCLSGALLYVVIGIMALITNGVPAKDGGFLQIMMSTRGRTQMEEMVLKEDVVGSGVVSKELLDRKVRFGELVEVESEENRNLLKTSGRLMGFGTVDETLPLRRRGVFRS
jgi:hypothetical protein